jgi:hypothetical protein
MIKNSYISSPSSPSLPDSLPPKTNSGRRIKKKIAELYEPRNIEEASALP